MYGITITTTKCITKKNEQNVFEHIGQKKTKHIDYDFGSMCLEHTDPFLKPRVLKNGQIVSLFF